MNTLVPQPEIIMRHNGERVEKRRVAAELVDSGGVPQATEDIVFIEKFNYRYFTEKGDEVSSKDIEYFQVKEDGKEERVRPFDRTKEIRIIKEVSASSVDSMLVESTYELFHKDDSIIQVLYQEAERFLKNDLAGIVLFSWGRGFKQFYGVVQPRLEDGKFVWLIELAQTKKEYQHLMEIPAMKVPIKQPPTLKALPPVEALLVAK